MAATHMDSVMRCTRRPFTTRTDRSAQRASSTTRSSVRGRLASCRSSYTSTRPPTRTRRGSRAQERAARSRSPQPSPTPSRTRCASAIQTQWSTACRSRPTESSSCCALGTDPRATNPPPLGPGGIDWRRNLVALWFAEFMAIFGFSFAFPFLSIFIHHDLGVPQGRELDLWTAAIASVSGFSMAIASPIWGVMGNPFGRKPMLLRSMVGGALTVGLVYFARDPTQLLILRFLQGATSGTVAAATALVAAETPRNRVGWALGVVTSAVALGGAIGPVVGGLAAALLGLRLMFLGGGILLLLSTVPVLFVVREGPIRRRQGPQAGVLA